MPKVKFDSFLVLGVDFKRPSRFFRLLGFAPHSMIRIERMYGNIDTWVLGRFKSLSYEQVKEHLTEINERDMSVNKYRACTLLSDAINAQLDRIDIPKDDPARAMLAKIMEHSNLVEGLKEFVKEY